jgi:hypothetical protein
VPEYRRRAPDERKARPNQGDRLVQPVLRIVRNFRDGGEGFFSHPHLHRDKVRALPTDNFAIMGSLKRRKTALAGHVHPSSVTA